MGRTEPFRRRGRAMRAGQLLPGVAARAYRRHGFAEARLATDWKAIVGEELAAMCRPRKLDRGGTLTLLAMPARALELQHREPQILERIAVFFGHAAVKRLKLRQGDAAPERSDGARRPRALTGAEDAALGARLAGIEDDGLRLALDRLGRAVVGSR